METLFLLVVAHALCDYPLQGDFLARAKNPAAPVPGVPWPHALAAHAAIHSGAVYLITGSPWCAGVEFVAHAAIDWAKCRGALSYNLDQALHVLCKLAFALAVAL